MMQETESGITMEITGVNSTQMPTVIITANVLNSARLPVRGLGAQDFVLSGELGERGRIVRVENITDEDLTYAVALVIDTSSSMAGAPIERAKEAARLFVNAIGADDPVAILTFDNEVRLVQDYTSDKTLLLAVIDALPFGGQTALYEAGLRGVELAAQAPVERRAMILLSDGAEFGGASRAARSDALAAAARLGVSAYTIGLGYGIDRSYLQDLAAGTNARFYESPTPAELEAIYTDLANLFRSLYVITLEVDVPLDGTNYVVGLQANTEEGPSEVDASIVRAPIPVPLVQLPDPLFAEPLSEIARIVPNIAADDPIVSVEARLNGEDFPFVDDTLVFDPVALRPGTYTLDIRAIDADGDGGVAQRQFEVAALPSTITLSSDLAVPLSEPLELGVGVTGQTAAAEVVFSLDGEEVARQIEAPFSLLIDPFLLSPETHALNVTVTNEGGVASSVALDFEVAALPPRILRIVGVEAGESVETPRLVSVETATQAGTNVNSLGFTLNGTALTEPSFDPFFFAPGSARLEATVGADNGTSSSAELAFEIAALPPRLDLPASSSIITDRGEIVFSVASQTAINTLSARIEEQPGVRLTISGDAPRVVAIDGAALGDGEYTLTITVRDRSDLETSASTSFRVVLPTPTPTPTATPNVPATETAAAIIVQMTADFVATSDAAATQSARADEEANATGTAIAVGTLAANSTATAIIELTATREFEINATGTAEIQAQNRANLFATATERALLNASAVTEEPSATPEAPTETVTPEPATDTPVLPTDTVVPPTETASPEPTATPDLDATSTLQAQNRANLFASATVRAEVNAAATADAIGTADAILATETQQAENRANLFASATARAELNAANAAATAGAQGTADAIATADALGTSEAAAAAANAQSTSDANATLTATMAIESTATTSPTDEPTATTTPTEEPATPTATPQSPTETPTQHFTPTPSRIVEVPAQEAPPIEGNLSLLLCGLGLAVLLVIVLLILRSRRKPQS